MKIKLKSFLLLFLTAACLAAWTPKTPAAADGIRWHRYTDGVKAGEQKQKKIFLYFYADWCPYCDRMKKESFEKARIISFLNENFVSVRVNIDREQKIAESYNVRGVPASWFLSEKGEKIGSLPGYVGADAFQSLLEYVHQEKYKE